MENMLFELNEKSSTSLQDQIRQKIVDAIFAKILMPGEKLPTSRTLSRQLGVARNTVIFAYKRLAEEGILVSHDRSGVYVSPDILKGTLHNRSSTEATEAEFIGRIERAMKPMMAVAPVSQPFSCWRNYKFAFLPRVFDESLTPVVEWREAVKLSLVYEEILSWSSEELICHDDLFLVEQIRTKVLPRRGIHVQPDEILILDSPQQALYITCNLLFQKNDCVAVEDPGNPQVRDILNSLGIKLRHQSVNEFGMRIDQESLKGVCGVYVTPSHQVPTSVTMPEDARHQLLNLASQYNICLIEDDLDGEVNYLHNPHPALKSMDKTKSVIYLSSLANILSEGVGISFVVAPRKFIEMARNFRATIMGAPAANNQRAFAYFLSLGHYESMLKKRHKALEKRWYELHLSLCTHFKKQISLTPMEGGSWFWIKINADIDVDKMCLDLSKEGVLLEPGGKYFDRPENGEKFVRLGITGIPEDKIREGIRRVSDYLNQEMDALNLNVYKPLSERIPVEQVFDQLKHKSIVCKSLYGDNYVIEILADGVIKGRLSFYDDEIDVGRWWIEDDLWCRQWIRWSFSEVGRYHVFLDGERVSWHDQNGKLLDFGEIK